MSRILVIALFSSAAAALPALADNGLNGKDAAYIDWGAKNCGVTSTDKEHAMVDQANAKDRDGFLRQYLQEYQNKNLADALATLSKQEAMCKDIKTWYGPLGTRIGNLIKWELAASTPDKAPVATTASKKGGRRGSNQQPPQ
jgi:hypothetical protein